MWERICSGCSQGQTRSKGGETGLRIRAVPSEGGSMDERRQFFCNVQQSQRRTVGVPLAPVAMPKERIVFLAMTAAGWESVLLESGIKNIASLELTVDNCRFSRVINLSSKSSERPGHIVLTFQLASRRMGVIVLVFFLFFWSGAVISVCFSVFDLAPNTH